MNKGIRVNDIGVIPVNDVCIESTVDEDISATLEECRGHAMMVAELQVRYNIISVDTWLERLAPCITNSMLPAKQILTCRQCEATRI